jgi:hypothetical protein
VYLIAVSKAKSRAVLSRNSYLCFFGVNIFVEIQPGLSVEHKAVERSLASKVSVSKIMLPSRIQACTTNYDRIVPKNFLKVCAISALPEK